MRGLVVYPCPLKNCLAELRLPPDFNEDDLRRVVAMLMSLVLKAEDREVPVEN
jgi:hypothetical protein